jgi:serine/threonine protein kinase
VTSVRDGTQPEDGEFHHPRAPLEPLRDRDPRDLGGFRLLGRLGYGGMGVAYLAERAGAWGVVKVIRSDLADSPSFRARLKRELEAMARAEGPFTAGVLASDLNNDPAWFAMEFIPGANLSRFISENGLMSPAQLQEFALDLAQAMSHIHSRGIIHRDIKPSNVMMSPSGPKLIDFGVAGLDEGTNLTKTGSVVGSTGWLAPEQITGDPITTASDVHAWALCVLFAATGSAPFGNDTSATAMYRVLEKIPHIPDFIEHPLRDLIAGAVMKTPSYRPTLEQIINSLHEGTAQPWTPVSETSTPHKQSANPPRSTSWVLPLGVGVAVASVTLILTLMAALGINTGSDEPTMAAITEESSSPPDVGASQLDVISEQARPSLSEEPAPFAKPRYSVRVDYELLEIPDADFTDTLNWTIDICSSDLELLRSRVRQQIRLQVRDQGSWTPVDSTASTVQGGRCGPDQINITMPFLEPEPLTKTSDWSPCRNYRVMIPETDNFQQSNVRLCVRTRTI